MSGIGWIAFIILFLGFFVGLSSLIAQDVNEVQYNKYFNSSNTTTSATGNFSTDGLPDAYDDQYTWYSWLLNTGDIMPNIPAFSWFFIPIALATGIIAFIVIIRGVGS